MVRLSLSRRKPATTVRQSTDQARVCLAVPPPASATRLASSTRASRDGACEGDAGASTLQAHSLGSCDHLWPVRAVTRSNGLGAAPSASAAFTLVPRCFPPYLVHLWCVSVCPCAAKRWVGLLSRYGERATKGGAQKRSPSHVGPGARDASTPPKSAAETSRTAHGSPLAAPARTLLEFGLATFRPVTLMEVAA